MGEKEAFWADGKPPGTFCWQTEAWLPEQGEAEGSGGVSWAVEEMEMNP